MVRFRAWNFSAGHLLEPRDGTLQPDIKAPRGDILFSLPCYGADLTSSFFKFSPVQCCTLNAYQRKQQKRFSHFLPHIPLAANTLKFN